MKVSSGFNVGTCVIFNWMSFFAGFHISPADVDNEAIENVLYLVWYWASEAEMIWRMNRISNNQVSVHLNCISHVVSWVLDQTEVEVFKQEASCCLWQHHRTHLTSGLSNAHTTSWNINSTKRHLMPAKKYTQILMKNSSYAWPADIFNYCMILFRPHWYPP